MFTFHLRFENRSSRKQILTIDKLSQPKFPDFFPWNRVKCLLWRRRRIWHVEPATFSWIFSWNRVKTVMMEKSWRNFGIVFDTLSRPYFLEFFREIMSNVYCDDGGTPEEFSASYMTRWAGHISLNFSWNLDKCLPRWKWGTPRWSHQSFRLEIIPIWFAWILRQIDNILVEYALLSHLSQKNMTKISLSSIVFLWFDESFLSSLIWWNERVGVQELVFLASKEKPQNHTYNFFEIASWEVCLYLASVLKKRENSHFTTFRIQYNFQNFKPKISLIQSRYRL